MPVDDTVPLPGPRWALTVLVVAAASCVLAAFTIAIGAPPGLRVPAVIALFVLAPGAAVLGARCGELGLVAAVSLSLDALGAQVVLWLGWHPRPATYVLALVCLIGLLVRLPAARRARTAAETLHA